MELRWSRRALADLDRIFNHIAEDSPHAATALLRELRASAEHLREHPYMGRAGGPDYRELVLHKHYLLTYRIRPGRIEVLQVWHTAQAR
jgi:addiction module RelE/StbE family toxin